MHSSIQFRRNLSPHYANCKSVECCPYLNLLNLVSFDEFDCTDQESTCIISLTGHSTKMHHKTYKKQGFFTLQFRTWMHKFAVHSSLLSFPLFATQNVVHYSMRNLSMILTNATHLCKLK